MDDHLSRDGPLDEGQEGSLSTFDNFHAEAVGADDDGAAGGFIGTNQLDFCGLAFELRPQDFSAPCRERSAIQFQRSDMSSCALDFQIH